LIPLIGEKRYLGKTMLSRITALLPLSSHVGFGGSPERTFVFAMPGKIFRTKE